MVLESFVHPGFKGQCRHYIDRTVHGVSEKDLHLHDSAPLVSFAYGLWGVG